jgi:hypothetical protein
MDKAARARREIFHKAHMKLKTAGIIYDAFVIILGYLRKGGSKPMLSSRFNSQIDILVREAWDEQELIGWDQILYGRISSKWGKAQGIYYDSNPDTRSKKYYTREVWVHKTIGSFLFHTLGLWNDRCDCMHGATDEEKKKIMKDRAVKRVVKMYEERGNIKEEFEYMFQEDIADICKRSTQYLDKWASSCRLAINNGKGGGAIRTQPRCRSKTKVKKINGDVEQPKGITRQVAPYSVHHKRWVEKESPRGESGTSEEN